MNARAASVPVLLAAAVALVPCAPSRAESVFVASDGIVVIEVESAPPMGGWKEATDLAGFTGRCYYTDTGGGGVLAYRFTIVDPGIYQMRIHNRHDFPDGTLQNDCFTKMDDGPRWKTFSSQRGSWTWATNHEHAGGKPPASYELATGHHTLEISGRSPGFSIDRIHIYKEGITGPTDTSRAESRAGPSVGEIRFNPRIRSCIDAGQLGMALAAASKASAGSDAAAASEASAAARELERYADERRAEIERVKGAAPVEAVELLADLAAQYGGCPRGAKLAEEARAWSREPAVRDAAQAARILEQIVAVAKPLRGKGTASEPGFAARYAQQLQTIAQYTAFLKKKYPATPACARAAALARELGIPLGE